MFLSQGSVWRSLFAVPALVVWIFAAPCHASIITALAPGNSIPYPDGGIYLSRGIYTTLAGGQHHNYGDTNSLYQWQGELGYFYTPWFSGGVGFKMIAGEPSSSSQRIQNRFFVLGRFHKSWSRVAGYLGTQIGMDDVNISLGPSDTTLRQPLSRLNAGIGLEFGLGWKFSRYVGATFGQRFEASFVGEDTTALNGAVDFRTTPGLAVDVLALIPSLHKKVKALNVFVESQFGQLVLENKSRSRDFAWITGVSLVF